MKPPSMRLAACQRAASLVAWLCVAATSACRPERPSHLAPSDPPTRAVVSTTDAQELRAFAKLYGYVRYFHPSDEAAAVDWNAFAIEGTKRVVQAQDREQLREILVELFEPIAPTLVVYADGETPATAPQHGDVVVAWQHLGITTAEGDTFFVSARTGRGRVGESPDAWAPLMTSLDAYPLRGKPFRFTGWSRAEPESEADHAMFIVDVQRPDDRPRSSYEARAPSRPTWEAVTIEGKIADDAETLSISGIANGGAPIWFDDFELSVQERTGRWVTLPLTNPGFEAPADISWAMRSTKFDYVIDDDAHSGRYSLRMQRRISDAATVLFPERPELGELIDEALGAGLRCRLPLALPSVDGKTVPHGAGWTAPSTPIADVHAPEVAAAAVVVTWNAIQHFYAYFDVVDVDWEAALDAAIADALDDHDAIELELTLSRMLAKLHDAHARVIGPHTTWGSAPLQLARVEGRVVVTAAAPATGLRRGDEVVAIDGQPVEARLLERSAFVSGSPQWLEVQLLSRAKITRGVAGTSVAIDVLRDEHEVRVETERVRDNRIDAFERPAIEGIAHGLYYVDLGRVEWPELQRVLPKLARAREIVFDVRDGAHSGFEHTLSHLLREPVTEPWMFVPRVVRPDRDPAPQWMPMAMTVLPAQPHIGARATFLIGASTVSSDETFTAFVQGAGLGETYGAPTAGTNGNGASIAVPGGFEVSFSGVKARRFDGTQYQVAGLQPTHPVTRTLAGVRAGRDEIRDAALSAAKQRLATK